MDNDNDTKRAVDILFLNGKTRNFARCLYSGLTCLLIMF